ncbi:CdaR family transcriptional regulator [Bacillus glycinifermentans]|uniref:CdaR family transcriptional regulator n=1 Tax=Bacillus glycinifermentans TaxID=1664069 RepID=UPI001FF519E0|nr:sugar diacid recognition domain-containing protein [Bacillus glycinifermentans]UOY87456.1 helix-turn-helix domain-containing protein [Bacillus glycinifermentans]
MNYLSKELAVEIVDRTMSIIRHNINIMDENGLIIASGDRSRIGDEHAGAKDALSGKSGISISPDECFDLAGTKPGVNLPIVFHDEIIGVIGITGAPSEVSPYGELVKMAAEMTVEQAFLTKQLTWDQRLREETVIQMLHGTDLSSLDFLGRAERLQIPLEGRRLCLVFELPSADLKPDFIKSLEKQLRPRDLYANVSLTEIAVLLADEPGKSRSDTFMRWKDWLSRWKDIRGACGEQAEQLNQLPFSYQSAKQTLYIADQSEARNHFYDYRDFAVPVLLSNILHPHQEIHFRKIWDRLSHADQKGELMKTLLCYIEENGEIGEVASRLFIHRNTLSYRLKKIKAATGCDPKNLEDLFKLYTAMMLFANCASEQFRDGSDR